MHRANDEAIALLIDLRDVAVSAGALDVFTRRVQELRARYTTGQLPGTLAKRN